MYYKTFLSIVALVLIVIAGYFVVQLNASPEVSCRPYFDFGCDVEATVACEGGTYVPQLKYAFCIGGNICRGVYVVYCEDDWQEEGPFFCDDEGGFGCEGAN